MNQSAVAQKVILQVPRVLLDRADETATALRTNRSNLIRTALEEKIERVDRERLDEELRVGYIEMAEQRRSDHVQFENLTTELLTQGA